MEENIEKEKEFKDLVHIVRGQQVMLDSDLATLYGTEVKKLIQQVKRNINKFPNDFLFQLTKEEDIFLLKSQNVTSSSHGGKRKLSYVFTEQGIYMVATILKNEIATQQSIYIMRSFKEMKHFLAENKQLLNTNDITGITNRLAKHEEDIHTIKETMATQLDIAKIMDNFIDDTKIKEIIILNGQKFDAVQAYISIYKRAKKSIYIVDDYININTLSLLKHKQKNVEVTIFTGNKGKDKLNKLDVTRFNEQYPLLSLKYTALYHDRFIIIDYDTDDEEFYHCGASSKDAGQRISTIIQMYNKAARHMMLKELLSSNDYMFK